VPRYKNFLCKGVRRNIEKENKSPKKALKGKKVPSGGFLYQKGEGIDAGSGENLDRKMGGGGGGGAVRRASCTGGAENGIETSKESEKKTTP